MSLFAVVLAAVLALRTTRSVVAPMNQLESAARHIATGDYRVPQLTLGTEEFERVGDALVSMTGAIAQRERQIERLAFRNPLTDLPNRTYCSSSAPRQSYPLSATA